MMLTPEQQGTAVVSLINILPHRDDLREGKEDFGCCPRCCAPCGMLAELIQAGVVSHVIQLAPDSLGVEGYDWWDRENGCLDLTWPEAWWVLHPCPNHEDVNDG